MKNMITVKEYAKKEGVSVQAVYNRIAKGLVKFVKIGSTFLVENE